MAARFWLALALVTAPAVARAQTAPPAAVASSPAGATDAALAATSAAQRQVAQVATERGQIAQRYQDQLAAIDRLKKERPSWRRDRELRDHLSESNETATQLAAVTARLTAAQGALARARRTAVAAIDTELASGAGVRAGRLRQIRAGLAPAAAPKPERIVVPDGTVDPLADPDELDAQAAALRASERQLEAQIAGLDIEARDLASVDELRKQHQRAMELGLRDDDQPERATAATHGVSTAGGAASPTAGIGAPPPTNGGAGGGGAGGGSGAGGGAGQTTNLPTSTSGDSAPAGDRAADTDLDTAAIVLGDVIDRATIDGLVRASRSNDPRERAEAARRARDAVAARLDQIRKMRAQIEARARQLRGAQP